jgi:hypothetical protein
MDKITLKYGMVLKDKTGQEFVVWKYWGSDTNPMTYKVALLSIREKDSKVYRDCYYSCDLVSLIEEGGFSIVK